MMSIRIGIRFACLAATAVLLGGCPFGVSDVAPALKQISPETQVLLAKNGMTQEEPIFVRIFKEESQLEIWKQKTDGRFYLFKTYPICSWSGDLGPKVNEGDKQAPEGFYTITPGQMNPNSQFHLAFNIGYPNSYDKVNGRTGGALMVHGDCRSAGCYAMTDALIEEIYALAREAFRGGQTKFQVHAFPFRMTDENMKRHRDSKWYGFWKTLKVGYDDFELTRMPPKVAVCSRQYLVNADFFGHIAEPDPAGICPAYRHLPVEPFNPFGNGQIMAKAPANVAPAANTRVAAYSAPAMRAAPDATHSYSQAEPQGKPAPAAPARPVAVSSEPATTAHSEPTQPEPQATGKSTVLLAGAIAVQPFQLPGPVDQNTQPVSATFSAAPADAPAEPEKKDDEAVVTRGIHNVVESGKSDMLLPGSQPR
ncbi:MAG: murein L,D-transpeptidase family protein [Rhodomicrobiaceae bacterium]